MNESSGLLLTDEGDLPPLQQLQKKKVLDLFDSIFPEVKLPNHLFRSFGVLVTCAVISLGLSSLTFSNKSKKVSRFSREIRPDKNPSAAFVRSLSVTVSPPSYTGLPSYETTDFNIVCPEGSRVDWLAKFSGQPNDVKILFSGRDSADLLPETKMAY